MNSWIKTNGKLIFDPDHKTKKHIKQGSWKRTAIIFIQDDLSSYYSWFIKKRYNLDLSTPLRGSHLTIINDKIQSNVKYLTTRNIHKNKIIDIEYSPEFKTDGSYWWLNAKCPQAENIRTEAGLSSIPYFNFHITIGRPHERQIEHSNYIHRQIIRYKELKL